MLNVNMLTVQVPLFTKYLSLTAELSSYYIIRYILQETIIVGSHSSVGSLCQSSPLHFTMCSFHLAIYFYGTN